MMKGAINADLLRKLNITLMYKRSMKTNIICR